MGCLRLTYQENEDANFFCGLWKKSADSKNCDNYYPFGAVAQSYSRENSVPNNYLYQRKEYQSDLGLNLYDFHARQYDPWAVLTTTQDPHADKYYSVSPYSWAGGNPLKYIDPSGKDIVLTYKDDKGKTQTYDYKNGSTYKGSNQFIKNFYSAVSILNKAGAGKMITALENSTSKVNIQQGTKSSFYDPKSKTLTWNPAQSLVTTNKNVLSPMSVLNHEVDHALDHAQRGAAHITDSKPDTQYGTTEERRVITGSEQDTALKLGEIKKGEVTRTDHAGSLLFGLDATTWEEMNTPKKDK